MLFLNIGFVFSYGVIKNQHFQSTLFGREGGGQKNEYSVYALDNVDNSGRPLSRSQFANNYHG